MSKTVRHIVTHITTLRSHIQQLTRHDQVIRRIVMTVVTDTWTLVWTEEESAEWGTRNAEASDQPQFMLGEEENGQENTEDQSVLDNQPGRASEPPVDAAPEIDE